MAYKKKLEKEFRLAEERKKFKRKYRYSGYQGCAYRKTWEWVEMGRGWNQNIDNTCNKQKYVENAQKEERKKAVYEKEKQEWIKKRVFFNERARKGMC